jgi:hypothetical protein
VRGTASNLAPMGSSSPTPPIALSVFYSAEDCNLFRQCWEVPGRQCSPYIIHPADPSYNITAHSLFTDWGALADAAGQLHAVLMTARQGGGTDQHSSCSSTTDAWQQVLRSTTLGAAVREFDSNAG